MTFERDISRADSEMLFFPYTKGAQLYRRVLFLTSALVACSVAFVSKELASFASLVVPFVIAVDIGMEVLYFAIQRNRMLAYKRGEEHVATIIKKIVFPKGSTAVTIRYIVEEKVVHSTRIIPVAAWFGLGVGDSVTVLVDRERPRNWVFSSLGGKKLGE